MSGTQEEKILRLNRELDWVKREIRKYSFERSKLTERKINMCSFTHSEMAIEESIRNIVSELKKREKEIINILNGEEQNKDTLMKIKNGCINKI
ncbi:MAG: hypothetical protein MUE56_10420 [Ignavibacteria bacterium]|jgi:hypothetical protein|nr:hypothetical protein [Ignavibacteria bacterium]